MASRRSQPVVFVLGAAAAIACTRPTPPDRTEARTTPQTRGVDAPPITAESAEPARAATQPCTPNRHEDAWRPLQTAAQAKTTSHCARPGCVEVTPVERHGAGCRDVGSRCQPRIQRPSLRFTTPGDTRAQELLDRAVAEASTDDCWLLDLDYTVHHDANSILDVSLRASGNGAYPSTATSHVTIDLRTGEQVTAELAFSTELLPELQSLVASKVHQSWKRALMQHPDILKDISEPEVSRRDLDHFIVLANRVVFLFDYGVPHAIALATPVSEFSVPVHELRRFVRAPGPLSWML